MATYIFLSAIGESCDLHALARIGTTGLWLLMLTSLIVAIQGALPFGITLFLRLDLLAAVVASQANIEGPASAFALARSLKRRDLTLPAVLVGTLGYAIGTCAGFIVAGILQRWARLTRPVCSIRLNVRFQQVTSVTVKALLTVSSGAPASF